jgi:putative tricarboxylic transport membrane protein
VEVISVLGNLLDPSLIIVLFVGTIIGIVIGALPGFTPTMGVALIVPFTFTMTPVEGLTLLGAIYGGSVYGGSIAAILLNIPGAPASFATILDGYPMAKKGEALKALYIALVASVIGGFISCIALLLFSPPMAELALRFGPAETFWVSVFGLTVIASLGTTKELVKGLLGGTLGLLIGTIGISPTTGTPRFTFGLPDLTGGVNLVAALIGLFAFSQALVYFEQLKDGVLMALEKVKGILWKSIKIVFRHSGLTFFSGVLGTIIGIIPGAGGQVAAIISYDQAKRYSKNKEKFGTGISEGIIAPESANNATMGGALIPLLTLGIPGSPTAAVLLGGLLIHGLWPGPDLFTVNADVTYTFMVALLAAQIVMLVCGALGIPLFAKVLKTPQYYLAPIILVLCVFGTFAIRNFTFDVYVMVVCGIIGYLALKAGIHPATIVLGIILCPYLERGLQRGLLLGEAEGSSIGYFFTSTISWVMIALILFSITATIVMEIRKSRKEKREQQTSVQRENIPFRQYIGSKESIIAIFFLLFGLFVYIFYASRLEQEAGLLPGSVLIIMVVLAVIQWFLARKYPITPMPGLPWKLLIEVCIVTILFIIVGQFVLGYYLASVLFLIYLPIRLHRSLNLSLSPRRVGVISLVSILFILILYISFSLLLNVPVPGGILF